MTEWLSVQQEMFEVPCYCSPLVYNGSYNIYRNIVDVTLTQIHFYFTTSVSNMLNIMLCKERDFCMYLGV